MAIQPTHPVCFSLLPPRVPRLHVHTQTHTRLWTAPPHVSVFYWPTWSLGYCCETTIHCALCLFEDCQSRRKKLCANHQRPSRMSLVLLGNKQKEVFLVHRQAPCFKNSCLLADRFRLKLYFEGTSVKWHMSLSQEGTYNYSKLGSHFLWPLTDIPSRVAVPIQSVQTHPLAQTHMLTISFWNQVYLLAWQDVWLIIWMSFSFGIC